MAEAFPGISKIQYEGPESKNPLAFKHYNAEELVEGKAMAAHLRLSVPYWPTCRNDTAHLYGVMFAMLTSNRLEQRNRVEHRIRPHRNARKHPLRVYLDTSIGKACAKAQLCLFPWCWHKKPMNAVAHDVQAGGRSNV